MNTEDTVKEQREFFPEEFPEEEVREDTDREKADRKEEAQEDKDREKADRKEEAQEDKDREKADRKEEAREDAAPGDAGTSRPEFDEERAEAVIEAILFTMGDTVEISKLAETAGCDGRTVRRILKRMEEKYAAQDRGILLTYFDSAVQLCTKPEMYEYLIKIAKNPKKAVLTDTVIETLSIIAYKQPVTRLDVESIRGVNCDHAINKLLEYDLITELGRLDAPGRPILFGTTEQFLRSFGVKSLDELPVLSTVQLEEFKAQAEAEIQIKLDI